MKSMYIGSGDCSSLLAGLNTKTHAKLLKRFVSGEIPYYNAYNSPIDALRTGAILEERYALVLPDGYYGQYKKTCKELNVLRSSIDFAKLNDGNIVDFDELKTANFNDYLKIEKAKESNDIEFIKKQYKSNYNQVQFQLLCSDLDSANLVFLVVYTYNDEENWSRNIKQTDFVKFRIHRDENVISKIKKRSQIFQQLKNIYNHD